MGQEWGRTLVVQQLRHREVLGEVVMIRTSN